MATSNASEPERDSWKEAAVDYAEQFGWEIVPLQPRPAVAEEDKDDPVIRLLGRSPFVDVPEGALSDPEKIRELSGYPSAALSVLTGTGSNLVAIEIGPAARRGLDESQIAQVREALPNTRCVLGPEREYHLFSLDGATEGGVELPRLTRSDGVILHGQESLIRVPGPLSKGGVSAFRWDIGSAEEVAAFPAECLSFFGVRTGVEALVSWRSQSSNGRECSGASQTRQARSGAEATAAAPTRGAQRGAGAKVADSGSEYDGGLSFRSGEELASSGNAGGAGLGLRWMSRGALTVMCGRTKTAGKSTLAVNVAAHLVAGRCFLGRDLEPVPVVMLSDLPGPQFRGLLSRIGVDRQARERLHVLHPKDAAQPSWKWLLANTCAFAERKQAGLIVFDSLDKFVEAKGGVDATSSEEVVHLLTSEAPEDAAVMAVKALSGQPASRVEGAIDQLGLLGRAADVVATLDSGPSTESATLRRLQFASRLGATPTHLLCEMVQGRYQKLERNSDMEVSFSGDGRPAEDLAHGDGSMPGMLRVNTNGEEEKTSRSEGVRPSIVHQELSDTDSEL